MASRNDAFSAMAFDLSIVKMKNEKEKDYFHRIAYSAMRPWVAAFCLDDGARGGEGVARQGIARRMRVWVDAIEEISPGMREWFLVEGNGLPNVYERLIDVGDIEPNGFTNKYVAHKPRKLPINGEAAIITGFIDHSKRMGDVCSVDRKSLITSGLATVAHINCESPEYQPFWWEREMGFLQWERARGLGELNYADLGCESGKWSLRHSSLWGEKPMAVDGLVLARANAYSPGETLYYVMKTVGRISYASRIDWRMAQELFYYQRMKWGNSICAMYKRIDDKHMRVAMPSRSIPGQYGRLLQAMMWPVENVENTMNSIIRAELLPEIEYLLAQSFVSVREIRK